MAYLRLQIEPIPMASRLATLAKLLPRGQWNRIRHSIYRKARYRCHVCGRASRLHCHEVWQFNHRTGYQHLRGFQALCQDCHEFKHIFFVRDSQRRARLLRHFAVVNKLTPIQVEQQMIAAREHQAALNQTRWLVNYGPYNWRTPATRTLRQRQAYASFNRPQHSPDHLACL
jgi:endonuclease III